MKTVYLCAAALVLLIGRANAAETPSYTKDVKPFLTKYCAECHGGRNAKKGISVAEYSTLVKTGRGGLVVPSSPDKSRLIAVMTGGGKQMPPRKFGKTPTRDEIAMLKAWIAAGAKDDSAKAAPEKKGDGEAKEEATTPAKTEGETQPLVHGFPVN